MSDRPTILLVEDDPALLSILAVYFEAQNFNVLSTPDGREAVELYQKHLGSIHVVLADLGLPSLGGWDMCKEILTLDPTAKILLASGFYEPSLRDDLLKLGAKEFIQKPYDPPGILKLVNQILHSDAV